MENKENVNVEDRILEAAADVFEERGFAGARMQQIADHAGINKALVHYYFRSKEILFEKVFVIVAKRVFIKSAQNLHKEGSVFEKITRFFEIHQDLLWKNRNFPIFFINEVNQNPDLIKKLLKSVDLASEFKGFMLQFKDEQEKGIIRKDVDPVSLLINVVSLSIFPYIGKPIISEVMLGFNTDYEEYLAAHRANIAKFVINSIKNPEYKY
jgi:TetR/AcrR family transcriptional regulator